MDMKLAAWEWECFESFINDGHFQITDPGPLHAPTLGLSIKRNENLDLIMETQVAEGARANATTPPDGRARINTDKVEMTNHSGVTAIAIGVQPYSLHTVEGPGLRQEISVHSLDTIVKKEGSPTYIIDWLENADRYFILPETMEDKTYQVRRRSIGTEQDGVVLSASDEGSRFPSIGKHCVKIVVDGLTIYFCKPMQSPSPKCIKPGFILYVGTPDEDVRRRIRTSLSYSLGMYLVYLGHTVFCEKWEMISFKAVSAYSLDKKVFNNPIMPPAPIGTQIPAGMATNLLNPTSLSRMVSAIYSKYDELQFGDLNWAYWHAVCAVPHIAAAHFGAAIESLQRAYLKSHPGSIDQRLITDKGALKSLKDGMLAVISQAGIDDDTRKVLENKISNLNQTPWPIITKRFLEHIGIELGEAELGALRHRNFAAHGSTGDAESPLDTIRSFQLLRLTFNRILLRVTGASASYYDYCSYDSRTQSFPDRVLREPVPSISLTDAATPQTM